MLKLFTIWCDSGQLGLKRLPAEQSAAKVLLSCIQNAAGATLSGWHPYLGTKVAHNAVDRPNTKHSTCHNMLDNPTTAKVYQPLLFKTKGIQEPVDSGCSGPPIRWEAIVCGQP
ncbi:hypothetical protein BaRGS_00012137 [Batillaria attramentaria]|uniref:Uncharacterized protein n=1 Tax=Batillaria attramentaria TaxID=370345 RepID=A0ABD0LAX0_9CAEN